MRALPAAIWTGDRSTPRKRASGQAAASGMMWPPDAQPISSTRAVRAEGVVSPNHSAAAASRAGCCRESGWEA